MFHDSFESLDWTLISVRSSALALNLFPPLAGQVGTGRSQIPLLDFCLMKVEKERSSLLESFSGRCQLPVVSGQLYRSLHVIRLEIKFPGSATRIAVDSQILVFIQRTTDDGPRTPTFGSELPFPLSGEVRLQSFDLSVLKVFGKGPGNPDTLPPQRSLRDVSVHKETPAERAGVSSKTSYVAMQVVGT